jgi:repressor LexA
MQDEKYMAKLRSHWKRNAIFPPMAKLCEVVWPWGFLPSCGG